MLRGLLLLLVGALVGANLVYFVMSRGVRGCAPAAAAPLADQAPAVSPASVPSAPPARSGDAAARDPAAGEAGPVPGESGEAGGPFPPAVAAPEADTASAIGPGGLIVPVQGVAASALVDTYTDARSEGRSHDAIDIMAPAGTPVRAVAAGRVEKLFTSERGGLTIYQFEPRGRYAYYYAHLQAYAPGLAEGQTVKQGQVIGTVGSTGNASPEAPHLHFAVFLLGPEKQWWKGTAINPYPLLVGTR